MKPEYAMIAVSVVFLVITIITGGYSIWTNDLEIGVPLLNFATYTFIIGIIFLIFSEMAHILKKHISGKHE